MKTNKQILTNQLKHHKTFEDISIFALSQRKIDLRVFYKVVSLCYLRPINYFSQEWLAKKLGISRTYLNEILQYLKKCGVINKDYWHRHTCHYSLPEYFYGTEFKEKMYKLMTAFGIFTLNLLISKPAVDRVATPLKSNFNYDNGSTIVYNTKPTKISGSALDQNRSYETKSEKKLMTKLERCRQLSEIAKVLPLTDHGICKLAAFNSLVINYVTQHFRDALTKHDPWAYLMGLATQMSKKNNYPIQWDIYFDLKRGFKVDPTDEIYLDPVALEELQREARESHKQDQRPSNQNASNPKESKVVKKEIPLVHRQHPPVAAPPLKTQDQQIKDLAYEIEQLKSHLAIKPTNIFEEYAHKKRQDSLEHWENQLKHVLTNREMI
jgi:predicted transcriptional regulator